MFGAVHLEVMLIMRCVLHECAKGTEGSSQQCLEITTRLFRHKFG